MNGRAEGEQSYKLGTYAWEFHGRYKLWPLLPYELKQLADPCAQRFVVGPSVGVVEVDWNSSTLRENL